MTCREHYLLKCLVDETDDEKYSEWEREFIWDLAEKMEKVEFEMSEGQRIKLEEIWRK